MWCLRQVGWCFEVRAPRGFVLVGRDVAEAERRRENRRVLSSSARALIGPVSITCQRPQLRARIDRGRRSPAAQRAGIHTCLLPDLHHRLIHRQLGIVLPGLARQAISLAHEASAGTASVVAEPPASSRDDPWHHIRLPARGRTPRCEAARAHLVSRTARGARCRVPT